jgi:hypothetical protein
MRTRHERGDGKTVNYHLTKKSANKKLGPMAVTTTDGQSCPDACPLKKNGCYADSGPLAIHWRKVTSGERGTDLQKHALAIAEAVADGRMIRFNQAGDLPGYGDAIDMDDAAFLLGAAHDSDAAWTYTHKPNLVDVRLLNDRTPVTVNVSANDIPTVARCLETRIPVVCLIPTKEKIHYTEHGHRIVRCPAEDSDITCMTCGNGRPLCSRKNRDYAIGFYPHGSGKKKALLTIGRSTS